jgi:hypothetical protein
MNSVNANIGLILEIYTAFALINVTFIYISSSSFVGFLLVDPKQAQGDRWALYMGRKEQGICRILPDPP